MVHISLYPCDFEHVFACWIMTAYSSLEQQIQTKYEKKIKEHTKLEKTKLDLSELKLKLGHLI